jgi:acyl transferase domain-containing protein/NADPH:quinone reductase-like Zn-dependent oxidoreductase/acyl carrier protein
MPVDRFDPRLFDDRQPGAHGMVAARLGGFLDDVEGFDAAFFGIAPREAHLIDPQHRLLLETAWEALEDAGIPAQTLAGSRTGVYVGLWTHDYERLAAPPHADVDLYSTTGTGRYAASGRISYALDLRGPSLTVDSACSSSLVAVHLACQSLRAGECSAALVGAANLILEPLVSVAYSRSGLLSRDGTCRFGDRQASGYVRSEGVGVVVLKPLARALHAGDRIRAVIRGSAVNNDGRASGLLVAPSASAQADVLRAAYEDAGIDPARVQYIEAHGTGTQAGDPIELRAIAELADNTQRRTSVLVGSVKTNIGHTEAASGLAGLIKVVLSLEHGVIPPSLHFDEPNPALEWHALPLQVCATTTPWPTNAARLAGVSSYGITGTNAHVVVEQAPVVTSGVHPEVKGRAHLVPLSARSHEAVRALARGWQSRDWTGSMFSDAAYTMSVRRAHDAARLAVVANGFDELRERLGVRLASNASRRLQRSPSIVFVFPGQGSQWIGMGRQLLESEAAAREVLDACEAAIRVYGGFSVSDLIQRGDAEEFGDIARIQPLLFTIGVMLARVWTSWGIRPAACIGHSMGEITAAHIAGALSLEDAVRIICARSGLLRGKQGLGGMALVEATPEETRRLLALFPNTLSIAVINGERATAVSGPAREIDSLLASLHEQNVFARAIKVDVASHSPQMDDLLHPLIDRLVDLHPSRGECRIYSTVTGEVADGRTFDADYWARNLREPVQFAAACRNARHHGHNVFIEISPHPILTTAILDGIELEPPLVLPTLHRDGDERRAMLESAAELFEAGCPIRWDALYPEAGHVVTLPAYPWQRERFWHDGRAERSSRMLAPLRQGNRLLEPDQAIRPADNGARTYWTFELDPETLELLTHHRVGGHSLAPAAFHAVLALDAIEAAGCGAGSWLTALTVPEPLTLEAPRTLQVSVDALAGADPVVRIYSRGNDASDWTLHCVARGGTPTPHIARERTAPSRELAMPGGEEVYGTLERRRLTYGPPFQRIIGATRHSDGVSVRVQPPDNREDWSSRVTLLDACLQAAVLSVVSESADDCWVPVQLRGVRVHGWPFDDSVLEGHVTTVTAADRGGNRARVDLMTEDGRALIDIEQVELTRASRGDAAAVLFTTQWHEDVELPTRGSSPIGEELATWVVIADDTGAGLRCVPAPARATAVLVPAALADSVSLGESLDLDRTRALHILHAGALSLSVDVTSDASARCRNVLLSIRTAADALARHSAGGRLIVLTRGAQCAHSGDTVSVAQTPLVGFASVVRAEYPNVLCISLDLDPADEEVPERLLDTPALMSSGLVALRRGRVYKPRLRPFDASPVTTGVWRSRHEDEGFRFQVEQPGLLDSLAPVIASRPGTDPSHVPIEVSRASLNFMNVLSALGAYPGYADGVGPLGIECVGTIQEAADGLGVGDRVVAIAFDSLASHTTAHRALVAPVPPGLSDDEAATIPIAFITAYYGLIRLARVQPGERILIHSAAGGVGLAALQIAHIAGAEVIATAGTETKREYLREFGVKHVFDSHSTAFADAIRRATDGEGVDVVLNALAGEAIDAGLGLLRPGGRFVELGKRDIHQNRPVGLAAFRSNISYHAVDLEGLARERPSLVGELLRDVMGLVAQRRIRTLPYRTYPVTAVIDAFTDMARGRHIGKLMVDISRSEGLKVRAGPSAATWADGAHLITGGLGALGLTTARWLVSRGARTVVLTSRRAPSQDTQAEIQRLVEQGANVRVELCDVARSDDVRDLLSRIRAVAPLRSVFHAAGVLEDALLDRVDESQLRAVMAPKVEGAWNLHTLTKDDAVDAFVLYSSVAGFIGSAGQASYAAANAFLDGLAWYRHHAGLPALAIQWGPWSGKGLAASDAPRGERLARLGLDSLHPDEGVSILERLVNSTRGPVISAMRFDARRWRESAPGAAENSLFDALAAPQAETRSVASDLRAEIASAASEAAKQALVEGAIRAAVARVARTAPDRVDPHQPLRTLGLDSLMTLELRNLLERTIGIPLSATVFWNYPTVSDLAAHLVDAVTGRLQSSMLADQQLASLLQEVESLSDDEVKRVLATRPDTPGASHV